MCLCRYERALRNLAAAGDAHVPQVIQLARTHRLMREALSLYPPQSPHRPLVLQVSLLDTGFWGGVTKRRMGCMGEALFAQVIGCHQAWSIQGFCCLRCLKAAAVQPA